MNCYGLVYDELINGQTKAGHWLTRTCA